MENVKLIDGLVAIDYFQGESIRDTILIICLWTFIIFTIFALFYWGGTKCKRYVTGAIMAIIVGMGTMYYPFKTDTCAKVVIVDPSKCTLEDIMKHYTIIDQEGEIYTIQLKENE